MSPNVEGIIEIIEPGAIYRMNWLDITQMVLENLYYISGIGMLATVIIGLTQLKLLKGQLILLKKDIELKNERETIQKSLEYLNWFSEFILRYGTYRKGFLKIKEKFIEEIVPKEDREFVKKEFEQHENIKLESSETFTSSSSRYSSVLFCMHQAKSEHILNQLEYFAAAMMSGLANEELAYTPLSQIYCQIVEDFYCELCDSRGENPELFSNIVALYQIWKSRREKNELQGQHKLISEKLSQIPDTKIKSIGL